MLGQLWPLLDDEASDEDVDEPLLLVVVFVVVGDAANEAKLRVSRVATAKTARTAIRTSDRRLRKDLVTPGRDGVGAAAELKFIFFCLFTPFCI